MEFAVEGMAGEGGDGAYDDELHAGSGHGYVHATEISQKTDVAVVVASHEGDDYDVALLPLKAVDGIYGNKMAEGLEERGALYKPAKILHLGAIWRDKAYVYAFVKKPLLTYFLDIGAERTN